MTGHDSGITRRSFTAAIGAAPLGVQTLGVVAAPALGATDDPDAELIAIAGEIERIERAYEDSCAEYERLENQLWAVPLPEAMQQRGQDPFLLGVDGESRAGTDRRWYVGEALKRVRRVAAGWTASAYNGPVDVRLTVDAQARADEILAAALEYEKARDRVAEESGFNACDARQRALMRESRALQETLRRLRARTLGGLAAKARVAERLHWSRLAEGKDATDDERMLCSIARDLVAVQLGDRPGAAF